MDAYTSSTSESRSGGCSPMLALVLASLWVVILTAATQGGSWLVDELINEGARSSLHSVQAIIQLVYGLGVVIPFSMLARSWKGTPPGGAFRSWALAGWFCLILTPIRLVGMVQTQLGNLLQIVMTLVFLAICLWLDRRSLRPVRNSLRGRPGGVSIALILAGLVGLPWLAWGALGSPEDILLNVVAALLLGLAVAWILEMGLFQNQNDSAEGETFGRFLALGWLAATALAVIVTGFGLRGHEWVLLYVLPGLGWPLVVLRWQVRPARAPVELLVGLTAAFPLLFVDPSELSLGVTGGPGELIQWVNQAGQVSLAVCLASGLILYALRNSLRGLQASSLRWALAVLVWVAGGVIYALVGQPGFYGDQLFVILKDQADLSPARAIQSIPERREYVYRTLVHQADTSQANLRAALDRWHIAYIPYYLINGLEVNAGPWMRVWLTNQPEVDRVLDSPHLRPLPAGLVVSRGDEPAPTRPQWNLTNIGADRVWSELGVTGKGVVVGQSDSGVQVDHPDLAASYRGAGGQNDYNWWDPWFHTAAPVDYGGHGTHTLGTILGTKTGVAPGAQWIGCANEARNMGNVGFYLDCMQFMLAPFPENGNPLRDGDPARAADVLNNSWGCPETEGCDANALQPAVKALKAAGIFVVASAGNDG
ncbi:MAG TPA: S8 family serine peptidase, partial [Anaerolineaceae bacterium]|nr:S8 family serine peptidase [Anaerolineaceae bacterium]